jgi:hypothetical protein
MFSRFRECLYKASSSKDAPLRVGLLIDSMTPIAFFAEVARDLSEAEFTQICLIIQRKQKTAAPTTKLQRIWNLRKRLTNKALRSRILYRMYCIRDERRHSESRLFAATDISSSISGVPVLEVQPIEKGFSDYFSPEDIQAITDHQPDVLIRFGFRILRGDILNVARYGIWSYHHGDQDYYRGSPAYFWEMFEDAPLHGAILQIINEKLDDGRLILKGLFAPMGGKSMLHNRLGPYLGSQHFVIDQLRRLHSQGWQQFASSLQAPQPFKGRRPIYRAPTNVEMLQWHMRNAWGRFKRKLLVGNVNRYWQIGVRRRSENSIEQLRKGMDSSHYTWLKAPQGHFWADPFLFDYQNKTFLFYEDYSYKTQYAVLACAELTTNFDLVNPQTILDIGTHASFPYVFQVDDHIYMVPETVDAGEVALYQAVEFPVKWKKVKVLIDLGCADTILWQHAGLWWMHTSYNFNAGHFHTALLYFSDSLLGDWTLHPQAPFSPDARYARNGGAIIKDKDGSLLRVSQSAQHRYGSEFGFFKINKLSTTEYSETLVHTVAPKNQAQFSGTHTYSVSQQFEAVDAVTDRPIRELY